MSATFRTGRSSRPTATGSSYPRKPCKRIVSAAALALVSLLSGQRLFATPILLDGITLQSLQTIRGVRQPKPDWCVPTVGYMMALYDQRHYGWNLLDPLKSTKDEIGVIAGQAIMNVAAGGATVDQATEGVRKVFTGLIDGQPLNKQPVYPEAWAQERVNDDPDHKAWTWNDLTHRIDANLPIMLLVSSLPDQKDNAGHAVFVFGYDIANAGANNEKDTIYLFDPFADASGVDTSTRAKEWVVDKQTLKILAAFDALDNSIPHVDVSGTAYKERTLQAIVTGASVPEPGTLALLAIGALSGGHALRRRKVRRSSGVV